MQWQGIVERHLSSHSFTTSNCVLYYKQVIFAGQRANKQTCPSEVFKFARCVWLSNNPPYFVCCIKLLHVPPELSLRKDNYTSTQPREVLTDLNTLHSKAFCSSSPRCAWSFEMGILPWIDDRELALTMNFTWHVLCCTTHYTKIIWKPGDALAVPSLNVFGSKPETPFSIRLSTTEVDRLSRTMGSTGMTDLLRRR